MEIEENEEEREYVVVGAPLNSLTAMVAYLRPLFFVLL